MISVEKLLQVRGQCLNCDSTENVRAVRVTNEGHKRSYGMSFPLCVECRKLLANTLLKSIGGPDAEN